MLGNEDGMTSHGWLFGIIFRKSRSNPGIYKLKRVLLDGFQTFGRNVIPGFRGQLEFGSEFRFTEGGAPHAKMYSHTQKEVKKVE